MKGFFSFFAFFAVCLLLPAQNVIHVNNLTGNDRNPGSEKAPVKTIRHGITLLSPSGRMEVANTGKVYADTYPGPAGTAMIVNVSGTIEKPVVINGNGATYSGLAVIPPEKWSQDSKNIYSLDFWPMSNMMRYYKQENYWHEGTQIWFMNGQPAKNCRSLSELESNPGAFWWDKTKKKVRFHLPEGKKLADIRIQLPANSGFNITGRHVWIKNFNVIHSWNDGFDSADNAIAARYSNCIALDNCGQGFSCHTVGDTFYENCAAVRCASSGSCDVDFSQSKYVGCVFYANTFEAGVYSAGTGSHVFTDCIISGNTPFEQIWQGNESSLFFYNCLIEGNEKNAILRMGDGMANFRNCTIRGGKYLTVLMNSSTARLLLENCLLENQKEFTLGLNGTAVRRAFLRGNFYLNSPGIAISGKLHSGNTYFAAAPFDKGSSFMRNAPGEKLLNRYGQKTEVGAKLPESVLALYEKVKNCRVTADEVIWRK